VTSGIRLGTAAVTTRGFGIGEIRAVGRAIVTVLRGLAEGPADNAATEARVRQEMRELCARFPIYGPARAAGAGD
jgi:glycine hydroxymethyltransferase